MASIEVAREGLTLQHKQLKIKIETWSPNSLRVRATLRKKIDESQNWALLDRKTSDAEVNVNKNTASVTNGKITCHIDLNRDQDSFAPWTVTYRHTDTGKELTSENHDRFRRWRGIYLKHKSGDDFQVEAHFKAYDNEKIYGLGQHQHGRLDNKGCVIELIQKNTEVNIPFLYSTRGYGFLWNNPAVGRVELGFNGTNWVADRTQQMDYWITAGDNPKEIMKQYSEATGYPPQMPDYATGFWQSKLRYQTQDELMKVAREYKERGLPLSVIVADFFHWTLMGEWKFDPEKWPDIPGMVKELDDIGVKLAVSIWPTVNQLSENFDEMNEKGYLVGTEHGDDSHTQFLDKRPEGPLHMYYYDSTNPEAGEYVWNKVKEGYIRHGIKTLWLDSCEPEIYPMSPENLRYHLGNGEMVTNIYPLLHSKTFYEGMRREGETDIILLTRSAWVGSQRYGTLVWSGDIPSTFQSLRNQVTAGLNIAMSGIPWWNTDIGGFHGGDPEDPEFRELIIRWLQFGVFCPVTRLHGHRKPAIGVTGGSNEAWSFGDETYKIIKKMLLLREQLRPYIKEQMMEASKNGTPMMRPLFFDFPDDDQCYVPQDEYMFGDNILVAPVLDKGARSRTLYLPANQKWREATTGTIYTGGSYITVEVQLESIPYFYRQ